MDLAFLYGGRADCTRAQVGAILVKDKRLVSAGYNGAPSGETHCGDGGCPRGRLSFEECPPGADYANCIAIHAEVNAIIYAGVNARDCVLYVTRVPCQWCAKIIKSAGIKRVVYGQNLDEYDV